MSWRDDLNESTVAVTILGEDFYETNGPLILAEATRLGKSIILVVPEDRHVPVPPLFRSYEGQKAQINIPTYNPALIAAEVFEQTRSWGLTITSGYEHSWASR